ncbi:Transcription initiation factor TFIID subunit beta [Trichophyton interdigitale]|uniref:Transcription initiation factor TFIID subunit beta n=1 Tax=Trichophyton interdigitale TaxID=101480 RepID=A0A9P5D0J9_9EURO|nr:Transcription initiation factor TFIID subunit beta [Trichophyton interdigitale]KAF3901049.1 Transcription initiation factor TFIID subunit beta [Trichophyton interdigitale]KAG8208904.1 Transcription initiation factor TFIID subunit beta [Trichophyton interdigitale]
MSLSPPPSVSLSLPNAPANPKKRLSIASASSNPPANLKRQRTHPLRQTSFPISADSDPRVYTGASSRSEAEVSVTGSFTGSFAGSLGGSTVGGRGRKKKNKKDKDGSASVKGGADSTVGGRGDTGTSVKNGTNQGDEDADNDDDDYIEEPEIDGGAAVDAAAEKKNLAILMDAFNPEQSSRYDCFKRTKLNKSTLRKIVNQTLSQSVPPNVVTTIGGYTKVFIGEIIEKARTIQAEWAEAFDAGAITDAEAEEAEQQRKLQEQADKEKENNSTQTPLQPVHGDSSGTLAVKPESSENGTASSPMEGIQSAPPPASTPSHTHVTTQSTASTEGAALDNSMLGPRKPIKLPPNPHRGPLLPSHIREALRRYKLSAQGDNVGFSGLSLKGFGVKGPFSWSVRGTGGRRLFG